MEELVKAIKAVGFPIVMCILLYYLVVTVIERNTQALNNNTAALVRITAVVDRTNALAR